jgi:hypothetical protein
MLNGGVKLNPKLWDEEVEQVPIRKGFGREFLARVAVLHNPL